MREPPTTRIRVTIHRDGDTYFAATDYSVCCDGASPDEALGHLIREIELSTGFPIVIQAVIRQYA